VLWKPLVNDVDAVVLWEFYVNLDNSRPSKCRSRSVTG
jgi:hypothetical protein